MFKIHRTIHSTLGMDFQHNDDPFLLLPPNMDLFWALLEYWSAVPPEPEVGSQLTPEQAHHYRDRAILDPFVVTPFYPHIFQMMQVLP